MKPTYVIALAQYRIFENATEINAEIAKNVAARNREIARKMKARNRPIDEIVEDTGLTKEEVDSL